MLRKASVLRRFPSWPVIGRPRSGAWPCRASSSFTGQYDHPTRKALATLIGNENFEERFDEEEGLISSQVMAILQQKFSR